MHLISHESLIKSPGEHVVAIEMSQQRAGLRHKTSGNRTRSACIAVAMLN